MRRAGFGFEGRSWGTWRGRGVRWLEEAGVASSTQALYPSCTDRVFLDRIDRPAPSSRRAEQPTRSPPIDLRKRPRVQARCGRGDAASLAARLAAPSTWALAGRRDRVGRRFSVRTAPRASSPTCAPRRSVCTLESPGGRSCPPPTRGHALRV